MHVDISLFYKAQSLSWKSCHTDIVWKVLLVGFLYETYHVMDYAQLENKNY